MNLLEVCCGSLESVRAAVEGGAARVELCAALELDGLTPAWEDLRRARAEFPGLTIHVLIRPRPGDFCYTQEEVEEMTAEIETALEAGADGIVAGCLTPEGDVDLPAMLQLTMTVDNWNLAQELVSDRCHASSDDHFFPAERPGVSFTFHRAFDVCKRPFQALEDIIDLGCDRILTSGQAPSAVEGMDLLRLLRERADGEIVILPGGGVTPENAARILAVTGCTEIHASASEIQDGRKITSARRVQKIMAAIGSPEAAMD